MSDLKLMDRIIVKVPGLENLQYTFTDTNAINLIYQNDIPLESYIDKDTGYRYIKFNCATQEEISEIKDFLDSLQNKLNKEISNRQDADTHLQEQINLRSVRKQILPNGNISYLSNEDEDEGACLRIERKDEEGNSQIAGIGVNDKDKLTAQIYSVNEANFGVRLDINNAGIYYTEGNKPLEQRVVDDNKIATLKDIDERGSKPLQEEIERAKAAEKAINDKISENASPENPVMDKEYIDKSISEWSADFKGNFSTLEDLLIATPTMDPQPNRNDFAVVQNYKPTGALQSNAWRFTWAYILNNWQWIPQYKIGGSSPEEIEQIQQDIANLKVGKLDIYSEESNVTVPNNFKFESDSDKGKIEAETHTLDNRHITSEMDFEVPQAIPHKKKIEIAGREEEKNEITEYGKAGLMSAQDKYIVDHAQLAIKVIYHDPEEEM